MRCCHDQLLYSTVRRRMCVCEHNHRHYLAITLATIAPYQSAVQTNALDQEADQIIQVSERLPVLVRAISILFGRLAQLIQLDEPSVTIASPRSSEKPTIVQPQVPSSLLKAPIYHPLTAFVSSSRQKKKPSAKLFKTLIRILHLVS